MMDASNISDNGLQNPSERNSYSTSNPTATSSKINNEESFKVIDETDDNQRDESNVYFFESDHLALKGNRDYQNILKTIVVLEAQRMKALQDLDKLLECQKEALKDPIEYVRKLQNGEDVGIPPPQNIANLPNIHWENYTSSVDPATFGKHKHMTRNKKPETEEAATKDIKPNIATLLNEPDSSQGHMISSQVHTSLVRGRIRDVNKPSTFNQLWSAEEQRRLEELLLQFPPEEVEAKRWQKIAKALGNRTTQQVASRVQKYFIKLAKAGLPIPGRAPNLPHYKRAGSHRHQRNNRFLYQSSTFLQAYEPRVYMSDDEDRYSYGGDSSVDTDFMTQMPDDMEVSDEEDIGAHLQDSEEYQELQELKLLKRRKMRDEATGPAQHVGYKCDSCEKEPIVGVRWHCSDCTGVTSVDLCENCVDSMYESGSHNSSHRLEPIHQARGTTHNDRDYSNTKFLPGDYNYLDPNYMPAT